jgi:glycosyltransferase involved in cell wall biosynthesis
MIPAVTHVISSLSTGGAERSLLALIEDSSAEVEHRVVVLSGHDSMRGEFESVASGGVSMLGLTRGARGVPGIARAIREVLRTEADIVHGWMHHGCLVATAAVAIQGRSRPCHLVWGVRNDEGSRVVRFTERLAIRVGKWSSPRCDVMISNSQRALHSLLRLGFSPKRSLVIPNGVVLPGIDQVISWRASTRSALGIAPDIPVAIYVGNLRPAKDPACLLRAIRAAVEHLPELVVLLAGRQPDAAADDAFTRELRALPQVRVMGEIRDVMPLISAADVLLLSSKSEGCPTVVLEAMACNRPVVSTDVGDVSEIVGLAGKVVGVGDGQALGDALVSAIRDRNVVAGVGRPSPRDRLAGRYERSFSSSAIVAEYRRLLGVRL